MKGVNLDFQHKYECCFSAQLVTNKKHRQKKAFVVLFDPW